MYKCSSIVFLVGLIWGTLASDILVLTPVCLKNYYFLINPIILELAERGHKITVFTCMKYPKHENISQNLLENCLVRGATDFSKLNGQLDILDVMDRLGYCSSNVTFSDKNFQSLLMSQKKFDAVISTDVPYTFALALADYRFSAVGITLINHCSSSHAYLLMGEYFNPAYVPDTKVCSNSHMNFFERLYNTFSAIFSFYYAYNWIIPRQELMLDKLSDTMPFLKDRPSLIDIIANKSLVLVPSHSTVDHIHPYSPRLKSISGVNVHKTTNPLPEDLENFISSSKEGLILISWGSLVTGEEIERCERVLLLALSKLKHRVIWKRHNSHADEIIPPNVKVVKWLPQQDILAHKKLILFMTHGGLNSMTEATHYGVPVIVTPFFFDQCKNAKLLSEANAGLHLPTNNFTVDSIIWAVNEVISNQKYKKTALRRSQIFRDRLINPINETIYWIEYVLKYGNILKPASVLIPFYKLFLLDILALIFGTALVALILACYLLKFCHTLSCNFYKKPIAKMD